MVSCQTIAALGALVLLFVLFVAYCSYRGRDNNKEYGQLRMRGNALQLGGGTPARGGRTARSGGGGWRRGGGGGWRRGGGGWWNNNRWRRFWRNGPYYPNWYNRFTPLIYNDGYTFGLGNYWDYDQVCYDAFGRPYWCESGPYGVLY